MGDSVDFYIFNLTNSIQGKIMHEESGPSINLKNINFINKVEYYIKRPGQSTASSQKPSTAESTIRQERDGTSRRDGTDDATQMYEKGYFAEHAHMMRDKLLDMFRNSEQIPTKDKRTIEKEFHRELKELKKALREIKATRKTLFAENNEKHLEIERLCEEILVRLVEHDTE